MNKISLCDVKFRSCHPSDVVTKKLAMRHNVMTELPTGSGDKNSHTTIVADR